MREIRAIGLGEVGGMAAGAGEPLTAGLRASGPPRTEGMGGQGVEHRRGWDVGGVARRCGGRAGELFGVPERTFEQRVPRPHRLELRDHQRGDIVGVAAIGVVILPLGRFGRAGEDLQRSEEHTSELQSLMRISYAVFCLKTKNMTNTKIIPWSYNQTQT